MSLRKQIVLPSHILGLVWELVFSHQKRRGKITNLCIIHVRLPSAFTDLLSWQTVVVRLSILFLFFFFWFLLRVILFVLYCFLGLRFLKPAHFKKYLLNCLGTLSQKVNIHLCCSYSGISFSLENCLVILFHDFIIKMCRAKCSIPRSCIGFGFNTTCCKGEELIKITLHLDY